MRWLILLAGVVVVAVIATAQGPPPLKADTDMEAVLPTFQQRVFAARGARLNAAVSYREPPRNCPGLEGFSRNCERVSLQVTHPSFGARFEVV